MGRALGASSRISISRICAKRNLILSFEMLRHELNLHQQCEVNTQLELRTFRESRGNSSSTFVGSFNILELKRAEGQFNRIVGFETFLLINFSSFSDNFESVLSSKVLNWVSHLINSTLIKKFFERRRHVSTLRAISYKAMTCWALCGLFLSAVTSNEGAKYHWRWEMSRSRQACKAISISRRHFMFSFLLIRQRHDFWNNISRTLNWIKIPWALSLWEMNHLTDVVSLCWGVTDRWPEGIKQKKRDKRDFHNPFSSAVERNFINAKLLAGTKKESQNLSDSIFQLKSVS